MRISLQEAADKLREAGRIVVTAHVNPDGDALGSSLALYHLLQKLVLFNIFLTDFIDGYR